MRDLQYAASVRYYIACMHTCLLTLLTSLNENRVIAMTMQDTIISMIAPTIRCARKSDESNHILEDIRGFYLFLRKIGDTSNGMRIYMHSN